MEEKDKDKDLEAASAKPEMTAGAADMSWSPTESSTDIDEKRHLAKDEHQDSGVTNEEEYRDITAKQRRKLVVDNDNASAYSSDSVEHGEPDLEHEEIEDAVSGHELDRQLSRVGSSRYVHGPRSLSFARCTDFAADEYVVLSYHRSTMSRV